MQLYEDIKIHTQWKLCKTKLVQNIILIMTQINVETSLTVKLKKMEFQMELFLEKFKE